MAEAQATVVITTKNRKEELANAIRSALAQDVPIEVLVIDDGSTDGTSDMVRALFPIVRLHQSLQSEGYIAQRNLAARLACTSIIVSIDDDAILPSSRTIRQTLADFAVPRVGAVAVPYLDVNYDQVIQQRAPKAADIFVASEYRGTAHALRRDIFNRLGGYRVHFRHQCEEGEYCMRLLDAGYVVRLGNADPIHHLESPKRDRTRIFYHQARNHILWAWYDVPIPHLPVHLAATTFKTLRNGIRKGYKLASLGGALAGYGSIVHELSHRKAVSTKAYRLFRRMRTAGPIQLKDVEAELPAMRFD